MSKKKKQESAEEPETLETGIPEETEETTEETEEPAAQEETSENETEPVAYIGPGIKHVAVSGTVYSNGLPVRLQKKIEEIPAINGLLVPVSRLAESYRLVRTPGTALFNLYQTVKEKL